MTSSECNCAGSSRAGFDISPLFGTKVESFQFQVSRHTDKYGGIANHARRAKWKCAISTVHFCLVLVYTAVKIAYMALVKSSVVLYCEVLCVKCCVRSVVL